MGLGPLQKVKCLAYQAYDRAKSTWLVSRIFYGGEKYEHFDDITVEGQIVAVGGGTEDGDWTFDVAAFNYHPLAPLHCEITPCYPVDPAVLARLKPNVRVRVSGVYTWDPTHLGIPGHWEIHPVKSLEVLEGVK